MPNILQTVLDVLVHYYKTKFEVSGGSMHPKFLTNLYRIQNGRKSATCIS